MDSSTVSIKESNYMTNILPQAASMNRGAWLLTEEIVECYRDVESLYVTGGALYLDSMPHTFESHGLEVIPSHYWKLIQREDRVIAWVIPNTNEAKRSTLDSYLVSVKELESTVGIAFDVADYLKEEKLRTSWQLPTGCDKS